MGRRSRHFIACWIALLLTAGMVACAQVHGTEDSGAGDVPTACEGPIPVDLLIVMQANGYTIDLVQSLNDGLPSLLGPLVASSRADVHVGVVLTDMGIGAGAIGNCSEVGYDGVLRDEGVGCDFDAPPGQRYLGLTSSTDLAGAVESLRCVLYSGGQRCYPQSLEALLKAVTPSDSDVEFRDVAGGHADALNDGFFRDQALLAILFATGYDDCSVSDPRYLWRSTDPCPEGDRCCEERLFPVERYRAGLLALGRRHLIVNVIAGVPVDATPDPGSADEIAQVLDRPEMRQDSPLCVGTPIDQAYPARRILELATAHPGVVRSVCDRRGLDVPLGEIGEYIAEAACY